MVVDGMVSSERLLEFSLVVATFVALLVFVVASIVEVDSGDGRDRLVGDGVRGR